MLRHLLTIENLPEALLQEILQCAENYIRAGDHRFAQSTVLKHKTLMNLFFEPSTRTRISFELAARRLGAEVVNFHASTSSTLKGETLLDTFLNLQAMHADFMVVRHEIEGTPQLLAQHAEAGVAIINAGDGKQGHPTQALLDVLTIRRHKKSFQDLSIAIVGDIAHSRVARSLIQALKILHVPDIRLIAPPVLLPSAPSEMKGVTIYNDLPEGLRQADVIVLLRMQRERMDATLELNNETYRMKYGLNKRHLALAKPDAIVMHPGPMNRGVEIESEVADGKQSVILQQVENGVAMRMAVLTVLNSARGKP